MKKILQWSVAIVFIGGSVGFSFYAIYEKFGIEGVAFLTLALIGVGLLFFFIDWLYN